jgi:hypothetical protein
MTKHLIKYMVIIVINLVMVVMDNLMFSVNYVVAHIFNIKIVLILTHLIKK